MKIFKTEDTYTMIKSPIDGKLKHIPTMVTYAYAYESDAPDFDYGSAEENESELNRFRSGELLNVILKVTASALGENGTYYDGIVNGVSADKPPEMDQIIPKRDGYELLFEQAQGVKFRADTDEILAYKFNPQKTGTNEFTIGVNPDYVPVMRMGYAFAKNAISPILILDGRTLNDNLVGIVMPMRLSQGDAK